MHSSHSFSQNSHLSSKLRTLLYTVPARALLLPFSLWPPGQSLPKGSQPFSALSRASGMSESENLMSLASVWPRDPGTGSSMVPSCVCGAQESEPNSSSSMRISDCLPHPGASHSPTSAPAGGTGVHTVKLPASFSPKQP